MVEAASEAEDDVRERLREVQQLYEQAGAAFDAAQAVLQAAHAMAVKDGCGGCHGIREAAVQDALRRIRLCEAAGRVLGPLAQRLGAALGHLWQIPNDLGEVYQMVYAFMRRGRQAPRSRPMDPRR